jgi:hypothetical protein
MTDPIGSILAVAPQMTQLPDAEERRYQVWRATLPRHLQYDGDYDLRGAYKDGLSPSKEEHFNDKYKLPNHPTFSTNSQYSTPDNPGGEWTGSDQQGWTFKASPANLVHRTPEELQQYWQQVEAPRGNKLVLPDQAP